VSKGVPRPNIVVSERAQVLMPYHRLFDQYEEERLSDRQFGSTKSGIAPFFSDKFAKIGFQVWELFEDERLKEKIKNVLEVKNLMLGHIYHKPAIDADELYKTCKEYAEMIRRAGGVVQSSVTSKTRFLIAGANVGATKTEKARALGTEVIDEARLLELLGETSSDKAEQPVDEKPSAAAPVQGDLFG
jgi:adenylosuccinate synthase